MLIIIGIDDILLRFLQFLKPLDPLINGTGAQPHGIGAGVDDKSNRVIDDGDDLGNFEVHLALGLLFGGTEQQGVLVDAEVVLSPTGEKPMPYVHVPLHAQRKSIEIKIA